MNDSNRLFDTDRIMMDVWRSLVRDFSETLPIAHVQETALERGGIRGFRDCEFPDYSTTSPTRYKQWAQLECFWKRYIFRSDVHSADTLKQMAERKFVDTQCRLSVFREYPVGLKYLLRKTRQLVSSILGPYDPAEHSDACRFSKNAVVGSPLARAYLDLKLSRSLTGSKGHIQWFRNHYLPQDHLLKDVLVQCMAKTKPRYTECTTLQLTMVPKSWKAYRTITPNTLLGSFHSRGLGVMIGRRLAQIGLDKSRLQGRHGVLAKKLSVSRSHVTADLSAASDSFTSQLIRSLVPYPWFNQLRLGRIKHCSIDNKQIYMSSFMAMGIGFTFELQTLLFYCLLETLRRLLGIKGFVSVFGDDLIYPRRLHKAVATIFPLLGFSLNLEKTFVDAPFRESCGSDFYKGIDVRPYMPEGVGVRLSRLPYEAFLYKLINGLTRRWDVCEIPITYNRLLVELSKSTGRILQVPPDFPDISGVRVDRVVNTWYMPWVIPKVDMLNTTYIFEHLRMACDKRIVNHLFPYYWDWFRQKLKDDEDPWFPDPFEIDTPSLSWVRTRPAKFVRSRITGQRLRRLVATINNRQLVRLVNKSGSTTCWI